MKYYKKRPTIFLDRDGVIIKEVDLLSKTSQIKILPNVTEAIAKFNQAGFLVICLTNQPVAARGIISEKEVIKINQETQKKLNKGSAKIDAFYFCPHHPNANLLKYRKVCDCRKPATGMIKKAQKDFQIDKASSWMIGDMQSDVLMGKRAGLKTIRVLTGHKKDKIIKTGKTEDEKLMRQVKPDFVCKNLSEAEKIIFKKNMKVVILAAGLGTRLRPLTNNIPKVMIPFAGKPLLEHQILWAKKFGFNNFLINVHAFPKKIKQYFGNGKKFGVNITYFYEKKLLGTAGGIKNMQEYLSSPFIVIYGDVFHRVDLNKVICFHNSKKGLGTLTIRLTDHPIDSDLVEIDKNFKIKNFFPKPHKKLPKTNLANTGSVHILEKNILKYFPKKNSTTDFGKDILPKLIKKKLSIYGYKTSEYIKDIGTPERYRKVQKDIKGLL